MQCGCCNYDTGDVTLSPSGDPVCIQCAIGIAVDIDKAERQRNWRNRFDTDDGEEEEV